MKKLIWIAGIGVSLAVFLMAGHGGFSRILSERIDDMSRRIGQSSQKIPSKPCSLPLDDAELKKILSPKQYRIMRQNGTEPPFQNAHWNNKKEGLYVDAISGEPLFSSSDKFDSGTGWPSFVSPIHPEAVVEKSDASHGMNRVEVRARKSDSHLGHVFPDGPGPTGLRYCINSAALRFIPAEDLEREGYGRYVPLVGMPEKTETAVFGAGCFWGVESAFRQVQGVLTTTAGYMGGSTRHPTYRDVCTDKTGHAEVVKLVYDPEKISYRELLDIFWSIHDPTTLNRQGPDVGTQYRSVIFYQSPEQQKEASLSLQKADRSGRFKSKIATQISPAGEFWEAEDDHQNYFAKRGIKPTCHLPGKYLAPN